MANGRGCLECCYCEHYRCHNPKWVGYDAVYEAGECLRYGKRLPDTTESSVNRVCGDFLPNKWYSRDTEVTADKRFSYFPLPLVPGILYGYSYATPQKAEPLAVLAPDGGRKDA